MIALALCLTISAFAVSCGKDGDSEKEDETGKKPSIANVEKPDLDALEISEYVRLGEYKGMTVKLPGVDHEEEAVWNCVLENAEIISVPEGLLEYYEAQLIAIYKYYAEEQGITLEEAFEIYGMSEANIAEEAFEAARDDLVFAAVIDAEGIELTEENINTLYDTYVERYTLIGYNESYIRENFRDEILDAMLYDKVLEFLMINNNFTE